MFLLSAATRPQDPDALAVALRDGLRRVARLPEGGDVVRLQGDSGSRLDLLRVDLTGAEAVTDGRPPVPPAAGGGEPDLHVTRLEVTARPLIIEGARVWLDLRADDAGFASKRDREGNEWLVLAGGHDGRAEARLAPADVETLLLTGLERGAARQGVRIEEARWDLRTSGPRSLDLDLWIRAVRRVVLADVRGTVHASGRVEIDDRLDATVRDLRVEGEGPVGGVVANLAGPYLRRYQGRTIPLTGLPLGVDLRDVQVDASDGLRVTASFGSDRAASPG